jgi:polyhydroxyalkanoate synthesis regulator phasin
MPEELETVLRLVAEGHLTPEEASPIIDALTRRERSVSDDAGAWDLDAIDVGLDRMDERLDRLGRRIDRKVGRRIERAHARAEAARARAEEGLAAARLGMAARGGRQLRIKVTERGRQVVNLRIPIGFVETALRFVPGLGGEQSQRIREAVQAGAVGPILDVEDPDGEGGVLISVE